MKKNLFFSVLFVTLIVLLASCAAGTQQPQTPAQPIKVATLAGPTGMGIVQLIDNEAYEVEIYNTPDQITPKVISGEVDVATIPSNVAAVLYNKMQGGIKIVAVNTMGVLYILENGDSVNNIGDLSGKVLYSTGQGATPEYAIDKIIAHNGIDNVEVKYMGAHSDLANAMAAGDVDLALVPEPFVSTILAKNPDVSVKIDLNDEWRKIFGDDAGMPMGVTIVSSAFADDSEAMQRLIRDYGESVEYVVNETEKAAVDIAAKEIVGTKEIAKAAIPRCGISFVTDAACAKILDNYFELMYLSNPDSVGGHIPGEDIYFISQS